MASMVDAFFLRGEEAQEEADEARIVKREKVEKLRVKRIEKAKEIRRAKELKPKPYMDPSLQRLLNGEPSAIVEQMMRNGQIRMSK